MHTAICAFGARDQAEQAVDSLLRAGFASDDVHIEHRQLSSGGTGGVDQGAAEGKGDFDHDRGPLASLGAFFASLFGRDPDQPPHVDTYSRHVEGGGYVVVVDAGDDSEAERARGMLQQMQGSDVHVVHRPERRRLRDIVGSQAGMVERGSESYEGVVADPAIERERAGATHRLGTRTGPDLRAPDVGYPPGPRAPDQDKPKF